jgi:hypothetical protein
MSELLLVSNPKRRRKKKHSRKGRMPAGLKKYWAARRAGKAAPKRHRRRKARANKRSSAGRRRRAIGYTVGSRKIRRRKLNPHRRHRARYRRRSNPMSLGGFTNSLMPTMKAGAWGAGGALGLDALWGLITTNLPSLTAYLTNPYVTFIAKALAAAGVGTLGGHLVKGRGRDLAVGAMTTTIHDFLKSQLQSMMPTIFAPGGTLSLGAYLSDYNNMPGAFGAYLSGSAPIMGTASIPQSYLPFSGSSGMSDGNMYADDRMGLDPWGS